ncbi:MAG TPA: DUF6602 domain-containing protein [Vicinamibacterales bacterium]|nr:DUF6602 domain-containing protein [Vicinamibacterales bacterium]
MRGCQALARELDALKDRVRELKQHWPTDGEWKESVLRTILRRHLPADVSVGRGFVVSAESESHQLDILIHDASRPVLFRDGDLVIVTPDAVLGIIEVKTSVTVASFQKVIRKLKKDISLVRRCPHPAMRQNVNAFAAVFAYDCHAREAPFLDTVVGAANSRDERIDFAAVGPTTFLRYWDIDPNRQADFHETFRGHFYDSWHVYRLQNMAAGYFIHTVVEAICPDSVLSNNEVWFPMEGREGSRVAIKKAKWCPKLPSGM